MSEPIHQMNRPQPKGGRERDAVTGWRRYLHWRPGQRRKIKRSMQRRQRRRIKQALKEEQRQALETVLGLWSFEPTHPVKGPLRELMGESSTEVDINNPIIIATVTKV